MAAESHNAAIPEGIPLLRPPAPVVAAIPRLLPPPPVPTPGDSGVAPPKPIPAIGSRNLTMAAPRDAVLPPPPTRLMPPPTPPDDPGPATVDLWIKPAEPDQAPIAAPPLTLSRHRPMVTPRRDPGLLRRADADKRFARTVTLATGALVLPGLALGWHYLVPDNRQMLQRLVRDGHLGQAAKLAAGTGLDAPPDLPGDHRFLAAIMQTEAALGSAQSDRVAAVESLLTFARAQPDNPLYAAAVLHAIEQHGVVGSADTWFIATTPRIPAPLAALWTEGLVRQHLAHSRHNRAMEVLLAAWDAGADRIVNPELLRAHAAQCGATAAILSRLRAHVVDRNHVEFAPTYLQAARECNREPEAIRALWPIQRSRLTPADYPRVADAFLAAGPDQLGTESAEFLRDALAHAPDLPLPAARAVLGLALARGRVDTAADLAEKLADTPIVDPEYLRQAAHALQWADRIPAALAHFRRAYLASRAPADFDEALRLASAYDCAPEIIAIAEAHGLDRLSASDRRRYAKALTQSGEYRRALEEYQKIAGPGPADIETLQSIARLQRALNHPLDALQTYRTLIQIQPAETAWRDQEFKLLILLDRVPEALVAVERHWRDSRRFDRLDCALRTAITLGDDAAITRLARDAVTVANLAPPELLIRAAYHLQRAGLDSERFVLLSSLVTRLPERLDLRAELALMLHERGDHAAVLAQFADHPRLGDSSAGARILLSSLLATRSWPALQRETTRLLNNHPEWQDQPDFAESLTHAVVSLRDLALADTLATRFCAKTDAGAATFHLLAARLLCVQGRSRDALPLYAAHYDRLPLHARLDYGWALADTGNLAAAESEITRCVTEGGVADPKLLGALGDLRLAAHAPDKAKEAYRRALRSLLAQ